MELRKDYTGDAVPLFKHALMELTDVCEGDSPASNVCSNGEDSATSDSQLLSGTAGLEQRIVFPKSQQQQQKMNFSTGELDQTAEDGSSCHPDTCWSSRVWDHPLPAVGGIESGELSGARADWDIKGHFWDWDNMVLLQGKGDAGKRLGEWAIAEGDEVNCLLPRETFHIGLQSGSSKTSTLSCSSGIPGVAATGKGGHAKFCSPEQKSQQKSVDVDHRGNMEGGRTTAGLDLHHHCKVEQYRSGGEQNVPRDFSLGQRDGNSSWDFQNTAIPREIEQDRRAMIEQQRDESLKRSDQQLVGQQNPSSRESQKVMGFLGLGGGAVVTNDHVTKVEEKDTCSNGGTCSGDGFIGLKLGKRTYFGDTAAVSAGKSAGVSVAVNPVPSCSSTVKKRGAAAAQLPRCQVEGCKMDLTTAKDYHRRHKVCAIHSKAAKVIVASIEQRFCQQCSRFHVLSEFDEGKRSCRRRLAGHNERRRKPQPDPLALASSGASMLRGDFGRLPGINFIDDRRHLHAFGEPHYLWQQLQHASAPSYDDMNDRLNYLAGTYSRFGNLGSHSSVESPLQLPLSTDRFLPSLSKPAADRLLMLLQQHPKALASNLEDHRIHQFQTGSDPMGQALSLSPSSGTRFLGLETSTQASHDFSGISDSGCALSLLSSQPWGSMTPSSVSLDFSPKTHPTLERMLADNPAPLAQQFTHRTLAGVRHDYVGTTDEPLFIQPLSQRGDALPTGNPPNAFRGNPQAPFAMVSDIDNHPMFSMLHGHDNRALHNSTSHQRPTIDLMELPSAHLHNSHPGPIQTANREFLEFPSSRPFDSAMYDTNAML
ncbi:hypothetical protein O6H91_04G117300 [Diphasiastrum complanatum]|uniref:Uncharacterized protein n=4 Tax=Diphasiastrum complanatum TaxID=34168 RepID=A0ACC2E138_DIPCM|nr:hypothetical protein O6H91_04G117300 [Diphasiastrum complanatum]KAJ7560182.1 hypothetical protein O6H91_04G117300 [Diphasiastrum complanatum]